MPAHMDSPLDVTHPSWCRTDGTARTIRSGAPSSPSVPSYITSSAYSYTQPTSQPQSYGYGAQYGDEAALLRPSTSAPFAASATSSTRRARGPRAQPRSRSKSQSPSLGSPTVPALTPALRPAVGEDGGWASTAANVSPRDLLVDPLSQSQIKRNEQAARFRSYPRALAIPEGERSAASGASSAGPTARAKENLRRTKASSRAPASHPHPRSKAYADIQPGDSWYRPAPPAPPTQDKKGRTGATVQGRSWYIPIIGTIFRDGKA